MPLEPGCKVWRFISVLFCTSGTFQVDVLLYDVTCVCGVWWPAACRCMHLLGQAEINETFSFCGKDRPDAHTGQLRSQTTSPVSLGPPRLQLELHEQNFAHTVSDRWLALARPLLSDTGEGWGVGGGESPPPLRRFWLTHPPTHIRKSFLMKN